MPILQNILSFILDFASKRPRDLGVGFPTLQLLARSSSFELALF